MAKWDVFAFSAPQFGLKMCCTDHFSNPNIAKIERKKIILSRGARGNPNVIVGPLGGLY